MTQNFNGERVLVTGGAGFIGSRVMKSVLRQGAEAMAFDNLLAQVHGEVEPSDFDFPLVRGDVRDAAALTRVVADFQPTIVLHLAAETGTGQSADEPVRYADVNVGGTARLIEALRASASPARRVVLAGTRAVYGEGAYEEDGRIVTPPPRASTAMAAGDFAVRGANGAALRAMPTPETAEVRPGSVYGSTKLMQEYLLQQTPAPWDHVILRFQNVYGAGQSLRNPYTGVLSIFCEQSMRGLGLNVYEDGEIHRDFVHVDDVVRAVLAAALTPSASGEVINIGAGRTTAILDAARAISSAFEVSQAPRVTGAFRAGDIRHAVADVRKAERLLGWTASVSFEEGLAGLIAWSRDHPPS
ncbi:NAD-dependent epimerase/dehydratase family protein [Brevundimonas balnearis]|uniref:NAD-dependent epimerase/dehydratase family protein n=1 Tax=Brevundimonas balnearis TaxID=1572858 RepID=A0ABV6QYI1_9CAUL